MEIGIGSTLLPGDPRLIDHIVGEVKSQGIFDQFRKECIADVDTKPAYQNLRTRVESSVNTFLCKQVWKPDMNKNQLRENLRKHIHDAAYLDMGVERIVDQVVNPKVYSVFMPQIEDVVYKFLGIERPKDRERNGTKSLKDLLPKDLDPVSPESDKNSLKDVSLESVDANMTGNLNRSDNSLLKDFSKIETNTQSSENAQDKTGNDNNSSNKQLDGSDNQLECYQINSSKNASTSNLNISGKSDEKIEEEEEDSPMFEPIDIMNFNESNDSHLSGISELTSHRSRSPDFSNDFSRDNLDFSNHDSQLSKVSSDSRLSIVTDFGLSNHASTPMPTEISKEESNKGKSIESSDLKSNKDNFKAIRDIEPNKVIAKEAKNSFETIRSKDIAQEQRDSKDSKATKSTPDSTDSGMKDNKNDNKDSKEKHKDNDSHKGKSNKDKGDIKESKPHKEREKDHRKRQTSHSSSKHDKTDKNSKDKYKDKSEKSRDGSEKSKEYLEKAKEAEKPKEDKKDSDKRESAGKDLKDIYKEKIRELREKKELTEKEKLAKDPRESKSTKDSRDRKDSSRDRKDFKSSTSKNSGRHDDKLNKTDEKSASKNDNKSINSKSSGKGVEPKDSKNELKDKGKREDKRQSKDGKESRSKSYGNQKNDSLEKGEKSDTKKDVKNDSQSKDLERSERSDAKRDNKMDTQRSEGKKDLKTESQTKEYERNEKSDVKKDSKADSQNKDKKRKGDKKTKAKDDHSSLRKNPNDRRSTDRDGSNGSSSRSSQKSSSSSIANSSKTGSTSLTKESSGTSNSSSETSDNVDISPSDQIKLANESMFQDMENTNRVKPLRIKITNENESEPDYYIESELTPKKVDLGQTELSLPLKKRPLQGESGAPDPNDFKVKKPKFAKNFQEAKKLMKIRKKLEKQRIKEYEAAKEKFQMASNHSHNSNPSPVTDNDDKTAMLPDDERVQIIEVTDDEYEEPYPDLSMKEMNISLERQSLTSLENPLVLKPQGNLDNILEKRSTLSAMEESIRESLEDMISDRKLLESRTPMEDKDESAASVKTAQYSALATLVRDIVNSPKNCENSLSSQTVINNLKNTNCLKTKVLSDDASKTIKAPEVSVEDAEKSDPKMNSEKEENEETYDVKIADTSKNMDSPKGRVGLVTPTIHGEEKSDSYSVSSVSDGPVTSSSGPQSANEEARDESFSPSDDKRNCLYLEADDERAVKFSKFLKSFEVEVLNDKKSEQNPSESLEKILESLGGQIVSSLPKTMAPPPITKRKHSTSPLMDILLNNTNNNNNRHEIKECTPEEESNTNKKRKLGRLKKPRAIANVCAIQNLPNGENFVMPLSPESDVSASSEKNSLNPLKEDKSRQRSSQRYSSDDLYKPRPFFSSSSRRSRRSNQA